MFIENVLMNKVVIFGVQDFASLAHFYFENDSELEVVAFSVHEKFLPPDAEYRGLPVIPFEEVTDRYPPEDYYFFAPMSAREMNKDRKSVYIDVKEKGYVCANYVSSKATVLGQILGDNCFILEDNTIQPFTTIGNNVVLWSGNHIGHHGSIADHTTVTSHVVISGHCQVGESCFFGVNATIRDGIDIAEGTFVAMASAVQASTEAWSAYKGSPAKKLGIPSNKIKM